jgi:HEAT repeat protein
VSLEDLVARLDDERESVRRLAVMDLAKRGDEPALDALCGHLERESDEKAALAIIRAVGDARYGPARDVLWRLYERRETPVRIAHGAILAHDVIELAVQSARGHHDGA